MRDTGGRDYSHLPVMEEFVPLPEASLACPHCGKLAKVMTDTEDSDVLEIDVRAHRRRIRRRRYRPTCDCDSTRRTLTAPPPPKLIPKGNYGISIWVGSVKGPAGFEAWRCLVVFRMEGMPDSLTKALHGGTEMRSAPIPNRRGGYFGHGGLHGLYRLTAHQGSDAQHHPRQAVPASFPRTSLNLPMIDSRTSLEPSSRSPSSACCPCV